MTAAGLTDIMDGEVLDGTFMDVKLPVGFYEQAIQEAGDPGVMSSLHLKGP